MPGNTDPIYSKVGDVSRDAGTTMPVPMTAAANDYTGISANHQLVFTADATNGGFIQRLRMKAVSTNVASVMRIYINNGSAQTTATNNTFYGEVSLPATTAIATAATIEIDYPMNFALNPNFRIYVGLGTAVAGGWHVTAIGGKY